jgi:hypothetical protein
MMKGKGFFAASQPLKKCAERAGSLQPGAQRPGEQY